MIISQTQCFFLVLLLGAAFGLRRGWGKEVITCAIVLGTVLFLSNGGGTFLANLFSQGSQSFSNTTGSSELGVTAPACTTAAANTSQFISNLFFGGVTLLGYTAGSKYGSAPKTQNHRVSGVIPGAVNGGAIAYYLSNNVIPGKQLTVFSPSGSLTAAELPIVFGFGFLALLVVLFVASQASKGK